MAEVLANVPLKKGFPRPYGRYVLEKNLSRGGMGEVFLAVANGVRTYTVIKTIRADLTGDKEFVGRFADEAKIMVRIDHPNIIRVFDCGKVGHDYYIAMEFVFGRDLGDVLDRAYERGEPLPKTVGLYVTKKLLMGLDYAHKLTDEKGRPMKLVHRDISPQNVLIGFDGSVKLIDFGLARSELLPSRTQGALAVGKYGYMSPEQAKHEPIDGRADIYSSGVMLFELFTSDRLVDEQDQASLWSRVLNPKHRKPSSVIPDLGDDIDELIMTAVAVKPDERFSDAKDMLRFVDNMPTKAGTREDLIKYLHYLYPSADFSAPAAPDFSAYQQDNEKSMVIAMSEKLAKSVFGRGELPVEWTMQLNADDLRAELNRRDDSAASGIVGDDQSTGEMNVLRSRDDGRFHEELRPTFALAVADDSPTTIAVPERAFPPQTMADMESTQYDRSPVERVNEARAEEERRKEAGRAREPSPAEPDATIRKNRLGAASPAVDAFRDDEATVMMKAPPVAVERWDPDHGESTDTEYIEPTRLSDPTPSAQVSPTYSPAERKQKRAIQEKKRPDGEKRPEGDKRPEGQRRPEPAPKRRPDGPRPVVHRDTVPTDVKEPARKRKTSVVPTRALDSVSDEPVVTRGPNFLLAGLILMGFTIILLVVVLVFSR